MRASFPDPHHNTHNILPYHPLNLIVSAQSKSYNSLSSILLVREDRQSPGSLLLNQMAPKSQSSANPHQLLASSQPEWQEGDRGGSCRGLACSVGKVAGRGKGPLHARLWEAGRRMGIWRPDVCSLPFSHGPDVSWQPNWHCAQSI